MTGERIVNQNRKRVGVGRRLRADNDRQRRSESPEFGLERCDLFISAAAALDGAGIAACRKRLGVPRVDDRSVLNGIFNARHTFPIFGAVLHRVFTIFLLVTFV
jgi:hypothetical protein